MPGSIYPYTVGLIFVEVRCICKRLDLFLYGSIYFLLFFILSERVSLYLCAFNIV